MRNAVVLMLSLCAWPAQAQLEQMNSLFSAVGGRMTGGIYELTSTLGGPVAGVSWSGTIELQQGFLTNPDGLVVGIGDPAIMATSYLTHPWPNPSQRGAVFQFGLAHYETEVVVDIYDLHGALVRTLQNGPLRAGVYRLTWDLRTNAGYAVAMGLYFVRMATRSFTHSERIVVVR